jgi:uncharacterized protein YxjI
MATHGVAASASQATGIALNIDFMTDQPLELVMKGEHFSSDFKIGSADGTPLFRVDASSFSTSHKKSVVDCRSGHELFMIRKEVWSMRYRYSAEVPEGSGNFIFETETDMSLTKGTTTTMTFRNAVKSGERDHIELQIHSWSQVHEVLWRGQKVAEISKESFKVRAEYHVTMVAGMDPLLVVVLAMVMDDRAKTRRKGAAGGAGAGASASAAF